jgi:hypothetical protein
MSESKIHMSYPIPSAGGCPEREIQYKTCLPEEVDKAIGEKISKYFDLVWYARKPPSWDTETDYWKNSKPENRKKCYDECSKIEELYPEEVDELRCPTSGNWHHGFNSGCLAAFRYIIDACDRSDYSIMYEEDPFFDPENPVEHDPLKHAEENFPQLDT